MRNSRKHRQERREQKAFVCMLLAAAGLILLSLAPAPVHSAEPSEATVLGSKTLTAEIPRLIPPAKTPDVPAAETQPDTIETEPPAMEPVEPIDETDAYTSKIWSYDWDGEDSYMLAKIAMAEAEGESVEGKALVILVVLNRAWDPRFPDAIEDVIFQENQFSPTAEGGRYWTTEPNEECYEALELVMSGWDESQGALYFESTGRDGWHSRTLEFLFEYGGHKFYK